ncbi:PadR family transcriptional regulator, regulatory protein PadR [Carnobacterium iners]|uniref:PadR family transcriptional regulator, regulatory protein PadR n=1 Tax=Carnobacterium iners TaxID=1073423 RepID=A0A1X7NSC1_9LACT|nr:Asp23/Gls24 family envelope stress response protein [Carnobacterium iners]SEL16215.1 PadR family transcriptional regulator, regulatory protein PadR [Carnobacterium iners]SMH40556.1 PadR family transcriptional regulator, regulatory protein PadR [Carnobacterium iners]
MAEESSFVVNKTKEALGEIEVAPEVIEIISGIAASKVSGVHAMRGKLSSGVSELFGRVDHKKGVHLTSDEEGLKVDVYCYLNYGVSVPKIALELQKKVREQLIQMTDIELKEVNIHVVGIVPEKAELKDLFSFDNEDGEVE